MQEITKRFVKESDIFWESKMPTILSRLFRFTDCEFEEEEIPKWLKMDSYDNEIDPSILNASRNELITILKYFYTHSTYLITFWLTLLGFILIYAEKIKMNGQYSEEFIGVILLIVALVAIPLTYIIGMNYRDYVAALVFATRLHLACQMEKTHFRFQRTIWQAINFNPQPDSAAAFIRKRIWTPNDAFFWFVFIVFLLATSCIVASIKLFISQAIQRCIT